MANTEVLELNMSSELAIGPTAEAVGEMPETGLFSERVDLAEIAVPYLGSSACPRVEEAACGYYVTTKNGTIVDRCSKSDCPLGYANE